LLSGRISGSAEYEGLTEDGKFHQLRLKPAGGRELVMFLDAKTYLPVRSEQQFGSRNLVVQYANWKEVNGILFPHEIKADTGRDDLYVLNVTEIRLNEKLNANLFQKPEEGPVDYAFTSGNTARNIPFELTSNHIYMPVQLNESKETLWFILDTGAGVTVLEAGTVKRLGIAKEGKLPVGGAGEKTVESSLISGMTFHLPGVEVRDQRAYSIPLEPLFKREGRRIDGILGYDFISRFVVEIDYASRKITLYDHKNYNYTGKGEIIPVVIEGGSPYLMGKIQTAKDHEPLPFKMAIDTGSRLALTVNKPFHEKHQMTQIVKTRHAPMGIGVGGATKDVVGRIAALQIGSFNLPNVITGFTLDTKGSGADQDSDANLGGEILRRFTFTIDYERSRVIFEKNRSFDEPFEYDKTGILFAAEGNDFRTFRVIEVLTDSPAEESGVQVEDVILSANGKQAKDWDYETLRAFFREVKEPVRLVLQRGEKQVEVAVVPRQII
jgi:Aspartyl protease/PDZ domain